MKGKRRGSTAFITNVHFSDWTDYLGDPPLVMALLDRVTDRVVVLRFERQVVSSTSGRTETSR